MRTTSPGDAASDTAVHLDPARFGTAAIIFGVGLLVEVVVGVDHAALVCAMVGFGLVADGFGWWRRFWFTPRSAVALTVLRVMIGGTVLAYALSLAPDLTTFFSDGGLLPDPNYRDGRYGVFQWWDGDVALWTMYAVLVASAVAVVAGRGVRLAGPAMWFAVISFHQDNPSLLNGGDDLVRIWTAYFAVFALLTPSRFLSVPLFGRREADGVRRWPEAPSWFLRVAQIQLTVIYPATVIAKLPGDTWTDGTAALYALGLEDFERFWIPEFMRTSILAGTTMTWATIAIELALPFLLWTRRTRWIGIIAGVGLHLGFDYTMRVGFFFWALAVGYAAFVRPEEYEWALRRVTRPFDVRRFRTEPGPPTDEPGTGRGPAVAEPVDAVARVTETGARSDASAPPLHR